jgi:hypothetical protein
MDKLRKIYENICEGDAPRKPAISFDPHKGDWKRTDTRHPDHKSISDLEWDHIGSYENDSGKIFHRYGKKGGSRLDLSHEERIGKPRPNFPKGNPTSGINR